MTRARGMPHDPPRTLERSREVDVAEPAATIGAATVCTPCVTFFSGLVEPEHFR